MLTRSAINLFKPFRTNESKNISSMKNNNRHELSSQVIFGLTLPASFIYVFTELHQKKNIEQSENIDVNKSTHSRPPARC